MKVKAVITVETAISNYDGYEDEFVLQHTRECMQLDPNLVHEILKDVGKYEVELTEIGDMTPVTSSEKGA